MPYGIRFRLQLMVAGISRPCGKVTCVCMATVKAKAYPREKGPRGGFQLVNASRIVSAIRIEVLGGANKFGERLLAIRSHARHMPAACHRCPAMANGSVNSAGSVTRRLPAPAESQQFPKALSNWSSRALAKGKGERSGADRAMRLRTY